MAWWGGVIQGHLGLWYGTMDFDKYTDTRRPSSSLIWRPGNFELPRKGKSINVSRISTLPRFLPSGLFLWDLGILSIHIPYFCYFFHPSRAPTAIRFPLRCMCSNVYFLGSQDLNLKREDNGNEINFTCIALIHRDADTRHVSLTPIVHTSQITSFKAIDLPHAPIIC